MNLKKGTIQLYQALQRIAGGNVSHVNAGEIAAAKARDAMAVFKTTTGGIDKIDPDDGGMATEATLRDMFAAQAPESPGWFKFVDPEPAPLLLRADKELSPAHYEQLKGLGDYLEDDQVDPEVLAYRERNKAAQRAHNSWSMRTKARALAAWRWYYADAMLDARDGGHADADRDAGIRATLLALREKILHDQGVSVTDIGDLLRQLGDAS